MIDLKNREIAETLLKQWIECYMEMNRRKLWTGRSMKPFETWTAEDKHICLLLPEIEKSIARMGYTIDNIDSIPSTQTVEDFSKFYLRAR